MRTRILLTLGIAALAACGPAARTTPAPAPVNTGDLPVASDDQARRLLVDVRQLDTTIRVDLRYRTGDNFTGAPLPGYETNRALMRTRILLTLGIAALAACGPAARTTPAPAPVNTGDLPVASDDQARRLLVDVRQLDATIRVDLRYRTGDNFTGAPLPGYETNRALMRREPAFALVRVQRRLRGNNLALKIFDAYRPVRATDAMVRWTERAGRQDLIRDGYIASRSRHNLGVAVDLTLVDATTGRELAMGTQFDAFTDAAHTANATGEALANRLRLKRAMESEGFAAYDQEWWHFSYPVAAPTRFDVVIR